MSAPAAWTFEERENGYRTVRSATAVFTRWRWGRPWEAYLIDPRARGWWKGKERFYRMLADAEAERLEACFERAQASERLGPLGMDIARDVAKRNALSVPGCVYRFRPETSEL